MSQSRIRVRLCGVTVAREGVARLHRHLPPSPGALFALEATDGARWPRAWAMVGRPVARGLAADGWMEVTRVASDGAPNACSALYGAASREARKRGAVGLLTYTLASEPGTSLRAAGWVEVGQTRGGQWIRKVRPGAALRVGVVAAPKRRWVPAWALAAWEARGDPLARRVPVR